MNCKRKVGEPQAMVWPPLVHNQEIKFNYLGKKEILIQSTIQLANTRQRNKIYI